MAGDAFKKARTGDKLRIPATAYNEFIDAAMDLRARRQGAQSQDTPSFRQSGIILVKNASGADRERFDVLGVDDPIFLPEENEDSFKNRVMFDGVTPVDPDHKNKFVILLEPLKAGSIGMACIDGVCPAWVTLPADGAHKYADISGGDATSLLVGDTGGAQILWLDPSISPGGSGWAVVRLPASQANDSLVVARVDSKADCGGCYHGTLMTGDTSIDPSAGTSEAMPYGLADGAACYIVNTDENGQDTHLLKVDGTAYVLGKRYGLTTSGEGGTGVPVVIVESTIGKTDSPDTLDGSSYPYQADTKKWDRHHDGSDPNFGGKPFTIKVDQRIGDDLTDGSRGTHDTIKILGYSRQFTVDAAGRWWEVSEETKRTLLEVPNFDLTTAPVQLDHTKHTQAWAFDSTQNKWVKLSLNEIAMQQVQWNASTHTLQKRTFTVYAFAQAGTPTSWVDLGEYEDCP